MRAGVELAQIVAVLVAHEVRPETGTEMDPARRVSEQDCTKPIDYSLGNIRCK